MYKYCLHLSLLALSLYSCDSEDAWDIFKTPGDTTTIERKIDSFNGIDLFDRVNVIFTQDTIEKLIITGPKNLLPKVTTEVEDNILFIRDNNMYNWVRGFDNEITATIHVKQLNRIYYQGIGNISSSNRIISDTLIIRSEQCSGDILLNLDVGYFHCYFNKSLVDMTITGTAEKAHLQISGTGFLRCQELITNWCRAFNQGSGDIYAHSSGYFNGIIEGSGNVFYTGNPDHTVFEYKGRGSGSFIEF